MKKIFLITLLSLGFTVNAYAVTPVINQLAGTGFDKSNVTISGLSFGSNSSIDSIEYLDFESGTDEAIFNETGWSAFGDSSGTGGFTAPRYDTAEKNGGLRSMRTSFDAGKWGSLFHIDHGQRITSAYTTFWVKPSIQSEDFTSDKVQWKSWRINHTASVKDSHTTFYISNWYKPDLSNHMSMHVNITDEITKEMDVNPPGSYWKGIWPVNQWYRVEIYVKESSPNIEDGTEIVKYYDGTTVGGTVWSSYDGNIRTRIDSDAQWSWIHFGQYIGNQSMKADIWYDDVFIQFGSQARVEIGDQSTWDNCTHREIQVPATWSDSSIDFTVNQGSFNDGDTAFVFVVDSAGNASAGYPITLVGGVDEPPDPPQNVQKQ